MVVVVLKNLMNTSKNKKGLKMMTRIVEATMNESGVINPFHPMEEEEVPCKISIVPFKPYSVIVPRLYR